MKSLSYFPSSSSSIVHHRLSPSRLHQFYVLPTTAMLSSFTGRTVISQPPFSIITYTSPRQHCKPKLRLQFSTSEISCCASSSMPEEDSNAQISVPLLKKKKRYRKEVPGEREGITEEMRFVAMRLRNIKGKYIDSSGNSDKEEGSPDEESENEDRKSGENEEEEEIEGGSWVPSMDGFVNYLVDSKLVFCTIELIVDKSDDVAYAYFRKTGLERSEGLSKDIEWLSQQDIAIPEPRSPGVAYTRYLKELAEKSAPLFLCHFYNIYFSHIAGGQLIARQVSEKLLEGRELEFYRWEGDAEELLKDVRVKLNMLGEHWPRDVKNKCLKEAKKSFKSMGQIVRLIIL